MERKHLTLQASSVGKPTEQTDHLAHTLVISNCDIYTQSETIARLVMKYIHI